MFFKIGALKNFTIFTGKDDQCWSLFLIKLYYEDTPIRVFSCEYCKFFKNNFFIEYLWWLFLDIKLNF